VVAQTKFVYALFASTNQVYGWSINSSTGVLTALSNFPASVILNPPQVSYNQYNMITDPAGNYLFISNSGLNQIMVFAIDSTTGALTAVPNSPFPTTMASPGNLATDGLGKYLYVSQAGGHTSAEIQGFAIGSNGALTPMSSLFNYPMWQLQGEASGKYMIGTSGNSLSVTGADDKNLYVFSINQSTGALTEVATQATTYSPFTIAAVPPSTNKELVYSFSVNDSGSGYGYYPIEGFQLNTTTGTLTELTNSPFQNVFTGQWGQFDQSGSNLIVFSNGISGSTTLTQLGPLSVDASGNLTQPISAATLVTPGYWVVTDP
jgi:6-phosphogluconolactonase (cycloisomerase 2 family)